MRFNVIHYVVLNGDKGVIGLKVKKRERNKRNSFIATKIVGVRAEIADWEKWEMVANSEGMSRNSLIVQVMNSYCGVKNGR